MSICTGACRTGHCDCQGSQPFGKRASAIRGLKRRNETRRTEAAEMQSTRARALAALRAKLRPGEALCTTYDHAAAMCSCPATHVWLHGLPALYVARSKGVDRCLSCGAEWTRRVWTWEPARLVRRAA